MHPTDNPFVNTPGADPRIYAYGFRNPFRLTFTPDGKLLVGDVGQATWEEVDLVTAGANYGWPLAEGPCNGIGVTSCATPSSYTNPIYAYLHDQPAAIRSRLSWSIPVRDPRGPPTHSFDRGYQPGLDQTADLHF